MVAQHLERREAAASESEGQHPARNTATHKANEKLQQGRGPNCLCVILAGSNFSIATLLYICPSQPSKNCEINVNVMKVPQMAEPKPMGK